MNDQIRFCRQCHRPYLFSEGEQRYFKKKGWTAPMHCSACREARRRDPDPYEGWESTMGPDLPKKKRHTRVHYAPYVVGGMRG